MTFIHGVARAQRAVYHQRKEKYSALPQIIFGQENKNNSNTSVASEATNKNYKNYFKKAICTLIALSAGATGVNQYLRWQDQKAFTRENEAFTRNLNQVDALAFNMMNQLEQQLDIKFVSDDTWSQFMDSLPESIKQLEKTVESRQTLDQIPEIMQKTAPATLQFRGKLHQGSGFIVQDDTGKWYILTNSYYTIDNALTNGTPEATYKIKMYNGSDFEPPFEFLASVAKSADGKHAESPVEEHDISLLEIPPAIVAELSTKVVPLKFRDINKSPLQVGETVLAFGSPINERDTGNHGIISNKDRAAKGQEQNRFVGSTPPWNSGSSGGPLIDMQGRVIGVVTLGGTNTDGISYSIRSDILLKVAKEQWNINLATADSNIDNLDW